MNFRISPSAINVSPISDPDDQDPKRTIIDIGDDAIIADAVFPEIPKLRALQGFADRTRIIELGNTTVKETKNPPYRVVPKLIQLALGCAVDLNSPRHNES